MIKKSKVRAKNIDSITLEYIISILDGWSGKLTWEALIKTITLKLNISYTRQALNQHIKIKEAFQITKRRLNGNLKQKTIFIDDNQRILIERIRKLETENARLKMENERLLEQFAVWAYNAYSKNLDVNLLNNPLPKINRDQTKLFNK